MHELALMERGRCRACGEEVALEAALAACPCGSFDLEILAGEGLRLDGVEVV